MKLPLKCNAQYYSQFMSPKQSSALFNWLVANLDLNQPEVIQLPNGKETHILPWRMIFLDPQLAQSQLFPSQHGRCATWFSLLTQLQQQIADLTGITFSVAVCLYYPDGEESLGFHSDLPAFGATDVIASISLGAERAFLIRSQDDIEKQYELNLEDGSLLVMGKGFQDNYEHALAKGNKATKPRFNISFRQFSWPDEHSLSPNSE
ncbi:alpha-ketoglutarate-dependent dioxygenase AlkB [Motilimonas cestriensis]|uniref:Alpha-ketoglutarate-dependent dioxygenase AlkB n=1 Tax=Motilimonas cestriensis TaxID=2742685 RepID=A0ABS8WDX6_9GAMM|nr:alpha-ketoglutarate-dependent dioxygenase AlkB [Motilimonas cestriensis]